MPAPRIAIQVRLSPTGLEAVDKRAAESDRTRAEMIRVMLSYADKHMPKEKP